MCGNGHSIVKIGAYGMLENTENWQDILSSVREMSVDYSNGIVLIGGVAVWLHSQQMDDIRLLQASHDADFYLSLHDFGMLRSLEEVTANRRLGKYQLLKGGVDFDVYVERNTDLIVPFTDVMAASELIQDIPCASLAHLLTLKVHAYSDRQSSVKGEKDAKDIAKILMLIGEQAQPVTSRALSFFLEEEWPLITKITQQNTIFLNIAQGNAHLAKSYRQKTLRGLDYVNAAKDACMDTDPNSNQGGYTSIRPKS